MRDDVKAEGKKIHRRRILQRRMDRMILEAYLIVVENAGTQGGIFQVALIAHNLRKGTIDNFLRRQINQGFDVIFGAKPLACRHLVMITDKLFGQRHGPIDDFNLIR